MPFALRNEAGLTRSQRDGIWRGVDGYAYAAGQDADELISRPGAAPRHVGRRETSRRSPQ